MAWFGLRRRTYGGIEQQLCLNLPRQGCLFKLVRPLHSWPTSWRPRCLVVTINNTQMSPKQGALRSKDSHTKPCRIYTSIRDKVCEAGG